MVEGSLLVGYKWDNGKYKLAAYSRNITNRIQVSAAIDVGNLSSMQNEPRTDGLQFKVNLGLVDSVKSPTCARCAAGLFTA